MRTVLALAGKDLRLLLRDKAGFFFVFFFPLVYCMFFGAIFSGSGDGESRAMRIVIVDEDKTDGSRTFIDALQEAPAIDVEFADREQARKLVHLGKRVAYVVLPQGFGKSIDEPFFGGGSGAPKLQTGIDPSRSAEAGMLKGMLTQYTYQCMQSAMSDPAKMSKLIDDSLADLRADENVDPITRGALQIFLPALKTMMNTMAEAGDGFGGFPEVAIEQDDIQRKKTGPANAYEVSFPQGIIWGLLSCSAAFGISFVTERTHGTLVRLRMSPAGRTQILAGKATACFSTIIALECVLFGFGAVVFKVVPDSVPLLAMATICAALAFVGIMMLLSVLGKTEQAAGGYSWAALLIMAMTGGGMIPLFFMPGWLKTLSDFSPVKWAILAMEGAIWRGFTFQEMLLPCGVLLGVGIVCFLIGIRAFRWTVDQ